MSAGRPAERDVRVQSWTDMGRLTRMYYADPAGRHQGSGWFASLSLLDSAELNVCGLFAPASPADARALLDAVGPDLPVVAFTSTGVVEARAVLAEAGFGTSPVPEAVMRLTQPPEVTASPFRVQVCSLRSEVEQALRLNAEAHQISYDMLVRATSDVFDDGPGSIWMAYDGDEPISTVSICRDGPVLGVMEMMTPVRHQRRGAGRALLSRVLNETWGADTERAVLFTSAAGQRLYESLGFVVADQTVTCFRGLDDEVLEAIGQAS